MSLPTLEDLAELHAKIVEADTHEEHVRYDVYKNFDGKWVVGWGGISKGYETKEEAEALGRRWARSEWLDNGTTSELTIHNQDGTFSEKNTYGHDPKETVG